MVNNIALGIGIGLIASCLQSLGLTIQRRSHVEDQRLPEAQQRSEYRRPLFLLGFSIFISSNLIGSVLQIVVLPIIILAPLGAISLLWNALFARLLLGDVFSPWLIVGTFGIIAGALLIAFFGIVPEPTHSLEDLIYLFSRPAFITYFSLLGVVVILCLIATHITEYALSRRISQHQVIASPPTPSSDVEHSQLPEPSVLTTGLTDNVAEDITATEETPLLNSSPKPSSIASSTVKGLSESHAIERTRVVLAFSYASFSGIISGMCLLFAKSGVELLLLTIGGDNQFWRWQAWMLLLGLGAFAILQLWYLHKALILANPTLVCPSAFCFYNLSSIINGLVYFNQFSLIPPLHLGLVGLGIVVLLAGVWAVSIQSGGGGVDVGVWDEEEDGVSDQESDSLVDMADVAEAGKIASIRHDGSAVSETDLSLPASPHKYGSIGPAAGQDSVSRSPLSRNSISSTSHVLNHFTSPKQRARFAPDRSSMEPSTSRTLPHGTHGHHIRSPSHPYSQFGPISPPLGGTVASTIARGGLQIGLSPISPGFSLVPRRPRHVSSSSMAPRGLSLSRSDTLPHFLGDRSSGPSDGLPSFGLGRRPSATHRDARRRRTVSEGDVGRMADLPSLASASEDLRRIENIPLPRTQPPASSEEQSQGRWKWLKRFTVRK